MVGCDLSALPDDFGSTREIKQIALTEIHKQQSGAGIQLQIAKSIKVTIRLLQKLRSLPYKGFRNRTTSSFKLIDSILN